MKTNGTANFLNRDLKSRCHDIKSSSAHVLSLFTIRLSGIQVMQAVSQEIKLYIFPPEVTALNSFDRYL
ncbi:hypothetical protein DIE23_14740 [Burkholderia sp. Bp9143]|uniref:hypothetical protein n=1 Tax=Burkholderia sp. Bp9143 TaxID=2184574 RepID=UPI000F59C1A2|nr:hypothetical protein [Burkholderia sp. Bp9143]RQR33448.1 hypothetical protein DIE23_14740 [Burkholderia sp. Bp9143]